LQFLADIERHLGNFVEILGGNEGELLIAALLGLVHAVRKSRKRGEKKRKGMGVGMGPAGWGLDYAGGFLQPWWSRKDRPIPQSLVFLSSQIDDGPDRHPLELGSGASFGLLISITFPHSL
jgi:hypothetical protein